MITAGAWVIDLKYGMQGQQDAVRERLRRIKHGIEKPGTGCTAGAEYFLGYLIKKNYLPIQMRRFTRWRVENSVSQAEAASWYA